MNFKEYYWLNEVHSYILMRGRDGEYHIIGPKSQDELPQAMKSAKDANNPVGMWTYSTEGGKLNLPPELADEKEPILQAHYARMGFNRKSTPEPEVDDDSDFIDPSVFNPNYGKTWKKYHPTQAGTVSWHS